MLNRFKISKKFNFLLSFATDSVVSFIIEFPIQFTIYPLIIHLSTIPLLAIMTLLSAISNVIAAILSYGYIYNSFTDKKVYFQASLHGFGVLLTSPFLLFFSIFLASFLSGAAGFQITIIMSIAYITGFIVKCLMTFKIWGNRNLLKYK